MPGDDNSGVFIGGWPDPGNDPFVAVNQGYEIQIDATDDADSTTGAIYNFQAPNAAARDQALQPAGAVEHVRDHRRRAEGLRAPERLAGQRVHLDRPGARPHDRPRRPPEPRHRRRGLLPRRPGQGARHRSALPPCAGPRTSGDDAFEGAAPSTRCKWDRTVRYDPATLAPVAAARCTSRRRAATSTAPATPGRPTSCCRTRPAGDWTIETTVKVPLVKCCQQAGLIVLRERRRLRQVRRDRRRATGRSRFELRSETGDVVARAADQRVAAVRRTTTPTSCG